MARFILFMYPKKDSTAGDAAIFSVEAASDEKAEAIARKQAPHYEAIHAFGADELRAAVDHAEDILDYEKGT